METKIKIAYRSKLEKVFSVNELKSVLSLIHKEFDENILFYIHVDHKSSNDMLIEFGDKCCFISLADEDAGLAYAYINSNQTETEFVDLYANCYPANTLCTSIDDVKKILLTFVSTGKPDKNYDWDEHDL